MPPRFFLSACEASGDAHGAQLIIELKKIFPEAVFFGLGGPRMQRAGLQLLEDMTRFSALGLGDVLRQYFKYLKVFKRALRAIETESPDAAIVIDSPAFNLRLAKKISPDVPVLYYISPQLWAWGARRIRDIQRRIRHMMVILPFEVPLYEKAGVSCEFVGHPLLDEIEIPKDREALRRKMGLQAGDLAVGLLAGSREKEVRRIFPVMLEASRQLASLKPGLKFFYSRSPNLRFELYEEQLQAFADFRVPVSELPYHEFVHALDFAFVTSGTATLETALLKTPFFLVYKTSASTYFIGKRLVRVPYLGLVNLLAGRSAVPEFIQDKAVPGVMAREAKTLLENPEISEKMRNDFEEVRILLGEHGASRRAAHSVQNFLRKIGKV